ncbi:hypothetical protein HER32_14685 [Hymenobacter sp. BT18]|uniref:hypothetical protein n=1 Tax=Hymenobacter sp. BT18 TaxID=2835648 RepID=UPI00143E854C|nr:hypothetical protein [Hymenobacter sp. BT18]QIX62359.1 hypothetical protein HER32_14685 [Hymenobacter sp. BT18]
MDGTWELPQLLGSCDTMAQQLYTEAEWAFAVIGEGLLLLVIAWLSWRHYSRLSSSANGSITGIILLVSVWLYIGYHALKKHAATQDVLRNGAVATGRILSVYRFRSMTTYGARYYFTFQGHLYYGYMQLPALAAFANQSRQESYETAYLDHTYVVLFSKADPANSYLSTDCPVYPLPDNP